MNLNAVSRPTGRSRAPLQRARPESAAFGDQLFAAKAQATSFVIPMQNEKSLYYLGHGDGQYVYVEEAEESTPGDPVVRIQGRSRNGTFDFTRHIHEIDPRCASYAELCALVGYQNQAGAPPSPSSSGILRPVPLGMQPGDFLEKTNYLRASEQYLAAGNLSLSIYRQGIELLHFYQSILSAAKKQF